MYAIVETGNKQYKVSPGDVIEVESLPVIEGGQVELDKVLMISNGDRVSIGNPVVAGAKVLAASMGTHKGDKVTAYRYKSKVRQRRKRGHRQLLTKLTIKEITLPGEEAKKG